MIQRLAFTLAACIAVPSLLFAQSQAPQAAMTPLSNAPKAEAGGPARDASGTATDPDYRIGPEDVLDISVWKNPELSRTVPVRPDGKVSLPLVNDINVSGLTTSELRDQLSKRLAEYMPTPEIAVIVREVHSPKVAVVGAVKASGRFELKSPVTVLEAIAMAQGFTDYARRDRIVVVRQEGGVSKRIPFNYGKITSGKDQDNFFVKPGDVIVVP
jgi:polysaccharide export outer membrane protein